jgi:hypothetical protein
MSNPIDLKRLIQIIYDQKDIKAELILDEGCVIEADDQAPLVKVINYFLNYLHQVSEQPIQIGLDLMGDQILLSFISYTSADLTPEISSNVADALSPYNAKFETEHKKGSYVQIKIHFKK